MSHFDGHIRGLGRVPESLLNPIEERLAEADGLWEEEDGRKPNRFDCFEGSTQHVVFQYPENLSDHSSSRFRPVWPAWESIIRPVIDSAVSSYGYANGRTGRIMLARLLAGREIITHVDASDSARVPHKIHVPIVTAPQVWFIAENVAYQLKRGFAYEVNNRVMHGGRNDAGIDRIHLIFDYFDANGNS